MKKGTGQDGEWRAQESGEGTHAIREVGERGKGEGAQKRDG